VAWVGGRETKVPPSEVAGGLSIVWMVKIESVCATTNGMALARSIRTADASMVLSQVKE